MLVNILRKVIKPFRTFLRLIVVPELQLLSKWTRDSRRRYPSVQFEYGAVADERCSFGDNVYIGAYTKLSRTTMGRFNYFGRHGSLCDVQMGSFCSIGPHVTIGLGKHPLGNNVSTSPAFYSKRTPFARTFRTDENEVEHIPVHIGNDVWIGLNAIICDGVNIGDGAVVGAGSVVTQNVPDYAIVGGVPAKIIRYRFGEQTIDELRKMKWWEKDNEWLLKNGPFFNDAEKLISAVKEPKKYDSSKQSVEFREL